MLTLFPCKNRTGIPAESCRYYSPEWSGIPVGFQVESGWIPLDSTRIIAGIPLVFLWNSGLTPAEFHWDSTVECRRNNCRHSPGIQPELLPAFSRIPPWNSTRIIAGIPLVFRQFPSWNSTVVIASIPVVSLWIPPWNSAGNNTKTLHIWRKWCI